MRSHSKLFALAAPALLSACVSQGEFPSLAPRGVERDANGNPIALCIPPGGAAPAQERPAPAAAANDPALGARLTALLEQARRGQSAFAELLRAAQARAARAGAAGSEGWIAAQQEISRLEAARAPSVDALAELDALVLARSGDGAASADDSARVIAAAEEARRLADSQQAELDRLNGMLNPS
jgi:hypothetical protein